MSSNPPRRRGGRGGLVVVARATTEVSGHCGFFFGARIGGGRGFSAQLGFLLGLVLLGFLLRLRRFIRRGGRGGHEEQQERHDVHLRDSNAPPERTSMPRVLLLVTLLFACKKAPGSAPPARFCDQDLSGL